MESQIVAKSNSFNDETMVHPKNDEQRSQAPSSHSTSSHIQFDIIGDVYVDLLCYLPSSSSSGLSLNGSDSTLLQPITIMAGGSTLNTATYLQYLRSHMPSHVPLSMDHPTNEPFSHFGYEVTVHSMLNPCDHYGSILLQHAAKYNITLRNGFSGTTKDYNDSTQPLQGTLSTPHCIVLISSHPSSSTERTFLTHRGCATQMTIQHLFPGNPNDASNVAIDSRTPRHVHIAGFFCTPGFWSPQTVNGSLLSSETLLPFVRGLYQNRLSNAPTILSLVTQCDASQTWDMTVLISILPFMHICIMNEHEALQMYYKNCSESNNTDSPTDYAAVVSFLTPYNPSTIFIITKGVKGAVAYRNGSIVGSVLHTVDVHSIVNGSTEPVVDPTGAGDAFCAGLFYSLWQTIRSPDQIDISSLESAKSCPCYVPSDFYWPLEENIQSALLFGCTMGTCSVSQRGASIPPADPHLTCNVHERYLAKNS
jgi:pfkB family carbohydrate kinase